MQLFLKVTTPHVCTDQACPGLRRHRGWHPGRSLHVDGSQPLLDSVNSLYGTSVGRASVCLRVGYLINYPFAERHPRIYTTEPLPVQHCQPPPGAYLNGNDLNENTCFVAFCYISFVVFLLEFI